MSARSILVVPVGAEPMRIRRTLHFLQDEALCFTVSSVARMPVIASAQFPLMAIIQGRTVNDLIGAVSTLSRITERSVPILALADELDESDQHRMQHAGATETADALEPIASQRARILSVHEQALSRSAHRDVFDCGPLRVDVSRREAHVGRSPLNLTKREFDLLVALGREPERVIPRAELAQRIGSTDSATSVESHLSRLRKKIIAAGGPRLVEPMRGVGYHLGLGPMLVTCPRPPSPAHTLAAERRHSIDATQRRRARIRQMARS